MPAKRKPQTAPATIEEAVRTYDVEATRRFLDAGAPAEAITSSGDHTLLSLASYWAGFRPDELGVVRLLLERGADPSRPQVAEELHLLAYSGLDELVRLLIDRGARIDGFSKYDQHTMLHSASAGGLVWLVDRCLAAGQSPNAKSEQGHTPLQYAVNQQPIRSDRVKDMVGIAKRLLDAGADIHYNNPGFWGTALHWAARYGTPEVCAFLLDRGARIDVRAPPDGEQPIHGAAQYGEIGNVKLLLERGADVHALDNAGWTPLHFAAWRGSPDKVQILLAAGAQIDAVSTSSRRILAEVHATRKKPLDIALRRRSKSVVALLQKRALKIKSKSRLGSRSKTKSKPKAKPAARRRGAK
jgi:ankyrin repeat protein